MRSPRSAVVIGGGVGGLVWALEASEAGLQVTVVERDATFGGAVRTERLGPVTVDVGAEAFALTRPDVLALTERLGIAADVVRPSVGQAHVAVDGRLIALPPGLLGVPAAARDIAAVLGEDAAEQATLRDAAPVSERPHPTLGLLVRERLGDAVTDTLVDPVVAGVHATRADDAELASVAPSLHAAMLQHGGLLPAVLALRGDLGPAGSPVASLRGGMGGLVGALRSALEERGVRLLHSRQALALGRSGRPDGLWQVDLGGERFAGDLVCLAVPGRAAAGLLRTTGEEALVDIAALLERLPTTDDVTLVTLLVEDAALTRSGTPVGSGVLVADVSGDAGTGGTARAKAMTHASAKWGWLAERLPADHHVLRLSFGGTHPTGGHDGAALVAAARSDALRLLDGAAGSLEVRGSLVTRWSGALSRPVVGRMATLRSIDATLSSVPGLALTGSTVAGNGLAGVVGRSVQEAARTLP